MSKLTDDFNTIEEQFFELDKENKIAYMKLEFDKPSDIFDTNSITKIPVLNDDFLSWIYSAFEYAPRTCKIDLDIAFNDMEGYDEETLKDIFYKNTLLEAKRAIHLTTFKNKIGISLIILGIIFFIALMLIQHLWIDGGVVKDIFFYISDIMVTVTFWEALTILIVENKEKRDNSKDLIKRFKYINFHKK